MVYNFVTRKIFLEATRQNSSKPLQHYGATDDAHSAQYRPWVSLVYGQIFYGLRISS